MYNGMAKDFDDLFVKEFGYKGGQFEEEYWNYIIHDGKEIKLSKETGIFNRKKIMTLLSTKYWVVQRTMVDDEYHFAGVDYEEIILISKDTLPVMVYNGENYENKECKFITR